MRIMTEVRKWWLVLFSGALIGFFFGADFAKGSIVKDCQTMGMFRIGNAPLSCTYHLISIPAYNQPTESVKEKKK